MGKQSTRENKNIYQRCREEQGLTREKASEKMIGDRYVPEIEMSELSNIILETIASLNEITPLTNRLIQITRDGMISDDEIKDFAFISKKLDEVSLAIDSLNLWIDKTASENNINIELLNTEKEMVQQVQWYPRIFLGYFSHLYMLSFHPRVCSQ